MHATVRPLGPQTRSRNSNGALGKGASEELVLREEMDLGSPRHCYSTALPPSIHLSLSLSLLPFFMSEGGSEAVFFSLYHKVQMFLHEGCKKTARTSEG